MTTDQFMKTLARVLDTILALVIASGVVIMTIIHAMFVLFIALVSIAWHR